jgi:hypothetical protein
VQEPHIVAIGTLRREGPECVIRATEGQARSLADKPVFSPSRSRPDFF